MEGKQYKVNKEKCVGCGSCTIACPGGTEMEPADGKAKVVSSAKLEECGGEEMCPYGAIEQMNGVETSEETEE
ncbi:MAG: 4Fe-4S binding protein [Candidatus Paceibacterota bacterium]